MGTENQVHKTVAFSYLFDDAGLLHHTAAESNFHVGIFLLKALHFAQSAVNTLVGVVSYGTGVENDEIRILFFFLFKANKL